jgi:hypothetical protein
MKAVPREEKWPRTKTTGNAGLCRRAKRRMRVILARKTWGVAIRPCKPPQIHGDRLKISGIGDWLGNVDWESHNDKNDFNHIYPRSSAFGADAGPILRLGSRTGKLWHRAFCRCRLDRHHRNDGDDLHASEGAGLRHRHQGPVGAGDLYVDEEQGYRRLPRQLDADDGSQYRPVPGRQNSRNRPCQS